MTGGTFGRIANNYAAYAGMQTENNKRVTSDKKGERITQQQADNALNVQLDKFYAAGGLSLIHI